MNNSGAYNPQLDQFHRMLGFLERDPGNVSLMENVVSMGVDIQEWNAVEGLLSEATKRGMRTPKLLAYHGTVVLRAGDIETAKAFFKDAHEGGLSDDGINYNLAFCHYLSGEYSEALLCLNSESSEDFAREYSVLYARCQHHLGEISEAISRLQRCEACATDIEAQALLSLLTYDSGELELAIAKASAVLDLVVPGKRSMDALLAKGGALTDLRRYDEAAPLFEELTQGFPDIGRGWYGLALLQFNNFKIDEALESITIALKTMADHLGSWHLQAWCYISRSELDGALEAFKTAYKLDRGFGETHGGLAAVYALQGERALANKHLKLARKLNAAGMATIYAEMVMLNRSGQHEQAKKLFDTAKSAKNEQLGVIPEILINERLEALSREGGPIDVGENNVGH